MSNCVFLLAFFNLKTKREHKTKFLMFIAKSIWKIKKLEKFVCFMSTSIIISFHDGYSSFSSLDSMMRWNKNGKSCFSPGDLLLAASKKSRRDREISSSNKKGVQCDWRKKDINYQVHFSTAFTYVSFDLLKISKKPHAYRFFSPFYGICDGFSDRRKLIKSDSQISFKISLCAILSLHLTRANVVSNFVYG